MDDGQTDEDLARLKSLAAFQKVVLGIAMRWKFLFLIVFCLVAAVSAAYLYMRGSQSVRRYQAKTSLLFTPKKTDRVEAMSEKQLIIVLERGSLKRRIADKVGLKYTPVLDFRATGAIAGGDRVLAILEELETNQPGPADAGEKD